MFLFLSFGFNSCFLFSNKPVDPKTEEPSLPIFNDNPVVKSIISGKIEETSGLVASRNQKDCIWVHEDSGNPPGLHLIGTDGSYKKFIPFNGVNRDWEDIAIGPGPLDGTTYIYIGDIGDNPEKYGEYAIYRFPEPTAFQKEVNDYETIKFKYPGGISYDSEALLLDPKTKDLYIITKIQFNVKVFKLAFPQALNQFITAEYLGEIPYFQITAGDISSDGTEILLKNYIAVYYWKRKATETVFQTLSRFRDVGVPYIRENQGEAIGWDLSANGLYTLSENGLTPEPTPLYYYFKK